MNAEPSPATPDAAADTEFTSHPGDKPVPAAGPARVAHRIPLWLLTLGVGLASGLIGWVGGEAAFTRIKREDYIVKPADFDKIGGYQKQALVAMVNGEARLASERRKAAVSFGLLGLVLGAGLGLVGGWAAGSSRSMTIGVVLGGLIGAAAGAAFSWVVVPLYFRYEDPELGMTILSVAHAVIFTGVGAAAGLALGLGLGDRPATVRALLGGLLGGFLGTMALAAVYSVAFPLMRTFEPIAPEPIPRLVMYLCVATGIGLMAGLTSGHRRSPRAAGA
jgi:hypothetical protein